MWKNGLDTNDNGEAVRLYQPIQYSGRVSASDAKLSLVGGNPSYFSTDDKVDRDPPCCAVCGSIMRMLVQLHVPKVPYAPDQYPCDRTLYVFACNRSSCWEQLFEQGPKVLLASGVVVCRRSQHSVVREDEKDDRNFGEGGDTDVTVDAIGKDSGLDTTAAEDCPWGEGAETETAGADNNNETTKKDDGGGEFGGDWGDDDDDDDDDDLEALVAAMEVKEAAKAALPKPTKQKAVSSKQPTPTHGTKSNSNSNKGTPALKAFEINAVQEPASRKMDVLDAEDNIGIGSSSDAKIRAMLERYMAEEEDEDILSALRGSGVGNDGGGSSSIEQDEALPEEERAMLMFTDRIKRSPRQVVRYAKGGRPMFSV